MDAFRLGIVAMRPAADYTPPNLGSPDGSHACTVRRPWKPDEHAGDKWIYRSVACFRTASPSPSRDPGHLGSLVFWSHGGHGDGQAADHSRFLRLPQGSF